MARGFFGTGIGGGAKPRAIQDFVTPGTGFTYTPTPGTTYAEVYVTGAGGRGGAVPSGLNKAFSGGGGGGGTQIAGIDIDDSLTGTIKVGTSGHATLSSRNSVFSYNGITVQGDYGADGNYVQNGNFDMTENAVGGDGSVVGGGLDLGTIMGGCGMAGFSAESADDGYGGHGGYSYWGCGGHGATGFNGTARSELGVAPAYAKAYGAGSGGSGQTNNTALAAVTANGGRVRIIEY